MANEEQLVTLMLGFKVWNEWREKNPDVKIDLREAHLSRADLSEANLVRADLGGADFREADLSGANLSGANLSGANLSGANLSGANLSGAELVRTYLIRADLTSANLSRADLGRASFREAILWSTDLSGSNLFGAYLSRANLVGAVLSGSNLGGADLGGADLRGAVLRGANLSGANLDGAEFSSADLGGTVFGDVNLGIAGGLDEVSHVGPSTIGTNAIARSKGKIPEVFLRGCGLSDADIEYAKLYSPELSNDEKTRILYKIFDLQASQAVQISPLFISYSHGDGYFVDKVEGQLNLKGIRFWRDIHDMKAGRMEKQIDVAIRQNPTVLLVLSKNSLSSDWVEHEVRTARELEKELGRDTLYPVALDDSWKSSRWPKRVIEQIMEYNILDFSKWEDDSKFGDVFRKLIDGLELFYKG